MVVMWNIAFFLALIFAAFLVNKKAKFPSPLAKGIVNVFLAIVFVMAVLQAFGIGK